MNRKHAIAVLAAITMALTSYAQLTIEIGPVIVQTGTVAQANAATLTRGTILMDGNDALRYYDGTTPGGIFIGGTNYNFEAYLRNSDNLIVGETVIDSKIFFGGGTNSWYIGMDNDEDYFEIYHALNPSVMFQFRTNGQLYAPQSTNTTSDTAILNLAANDNRYMGINGTTNTSSISISSPSSVGLTSSGGTVSIIGQPVDISGGTIINDGLQIADVGIDVGGNPIYNLSDPTAGTHVGDRDYNDIRYLNLVTKTTSSDYTVGTTDPNEKYGGIIYVTASCAITAPPAAAGVHYTVKSMGSVTVTNVPDTGDKFWLDGVPLDANDKITSDGDSGAVITIAYYAVDTFDTTSSTNWIDGGP